MSIKQKLIDYLTTSDAVITEAHVQAKGETQATIRYYVEVTVPTAKVVEMTSEDTQPKPTTSPKGPRGRGGSNV